jgi:gas vesicle protein
VKDMSKPELTQKTQQQIGKLNLRINDMMEELNSTIKTLLEEIQTKDAKIKELQVTVKKEPEAAPPA